MEKEIIFAYFNSRPHGGRLLWLIPVLQIVHFNSRPHGGRRIRSSLFSTLSDFNSRPHGGRPRIHALQEMSLNFNSRPHGGRPFLCSFFFPLFSFQLTPSRRATPGQTQERLWYEISTHALTEGDGKTLLIRLAVKAFQLTPSRRATLSTMASREWIEISTHALTEGDSKFRQIFLLNRGYAYLISLYFLPHFISLLPQILSFQQKSFKFQVRIFLLFSVHLAFALQNQCVHHVKSRFCTNMFYFVFVLFTQIVKPQTIGLFIYDFF